MNTRGPLRERIKNKIKAPPASLYSNKDCQIELTNKGYTTYIKSETPESQLPNNDKQQTLLPIPLILYPST